MGPADRCPYCGAESAKNPFIRRLRIGSLALALAGLACLYLMASHRELPVLEIDTISPMMNFAYVRVVGVVQNKVRVAERNGKVDYVSFMLDDGTGRLLVQAYRESARAIVDAGNVPAKGQLVDVAGNLSVAAESMRKLRVRTPRQLKLLTCAPGDVP